MEELRILSPTAILGYGFPPESFEAALGEKPDVIAVDAGSTDAGPFLLGGVIPRGMIIPVKKDVEKLLLAARRLGIPLLIGSAGGAGADPHLESVVEVVREVAAAQGLHFPMAVIHSEVDRETVIEALGRGRIRPMENTGPLSETEVRQSAHIVAQIGPEPFVEALDRGAEVVVAGRAYDPSMFAAPALRLGYPEGLALHLGKILECGAIAATPGSGSDCMMGYLRRDHFLVEPTAPARRCTPLSVAAHTLYEKPHPYMLHGPGGCLDLSGCRFDPVNDRRVMVSGSRFLPDRQYCVKLEGAGPAGIRSIFIAGIRDPMLIASLDQTLESVERQVRAYFTGEGDFHVSYRVYGRDGVMGGMESEACTASEVGLVVEVVSGSGELSAGACAMIRSTLLHCDYPGRKATSGNLAFPFSPSDISMGPAYRFTVYHLLEVDHPCSLVRTRYINV